MVSVSELLEKINGILGKEIDQIRLEEIVGIENRLSDAVVEQIGATSTVSAFGKYFTKSREGYALSRLGHISANPSIKEKLDALTKTYVYYQDKGYYPENALYVNYAPEHAEEFKDVLIAASKEEWESYTKKKATPHQLFVLSGERGIGKTGFINHFVTRFNSELDAQNVLWIRLDLHESFGGENPDVMHWLRSKIALVVFRYYDGAFVENICEFVKKKIEEDIQPDYRSDYHDNLLRIRDHFMKKEGTEVLTDRSIKDWLARKIHDYLVISGFSFIFILDGFDQLDIFPRLKRRFDHICDRVGELLSADTQMAGCYLIVTRNETTKYFTGKESYPTERYPIYCYREVIKVPFESIINKRLDFIRNKAEEIAPERDWQMSGWVEHIKEYKKYLVRKMEIESFGGFISRIDEVYGKNHRAKVQLLQLCYHDFLTESSMPTRYKLTELMCLGGYDFPQKVYQYEIENNDLVPKTSSKVFDNVLLPNIFAFPYHVDYKWKKKPFSLTYLLAPLRIIQVFQAVINEIENRDVYVEVSAAKVKEQMEGLFGYEFGILFKLLEEFNEYKFVINQGGAVYFPQDIDNIRFLITPKLNFIFGAHPRHWRTNVLRDIAYLNMSAMRTLVNAEAVSAKQRCPLFKAMNPSTPGVSISDWNSWKIVNSISLLRLIKALDKIEKKCVEKSELGKRHQEILNNTKFFDLIPGIEGSIVRQIKALIEKMGDSGLKILSDILSEYNRCW